MTDIRFTAGTTVYQAARNRTATVVHDAYEHEPLVVRWNDTHQEERVPPEFVESERQHEQRKAGTRR